MEEGRELMSSQRPCGSEKCEREECRDAWAIKETLDRVRASRPTEDEMAEFLGALLDVYSQHQRVLRLISGQPGYATFTVKQILGAINDDA